MPGWTQGHLPFLDLWYKLSRLLSACPPGHCLAWCPVYVKSKRQDIGICLFPLNYVWKGSQRSREMDMVRIYKVKWTKDIATLLMPFNKTLLKPGTMQKSGIELDKTLALMVGAHRLVWETGRKGDCNTACERTTASPACLVPNSLPFFTLCSGNRLLLLDVWHHVHTDFQRQFICLFFWLNYKFPKERGQVLFLSCHSQCIT